MPQYWDFFASTQMAQSVVRVSEMARTTPDKVFATELIAWINGLKSDLRRLSTTLPPKIDEHIREALEATRKRPPTDKSRHLKDNIHSEPYRTGGANNLGAIGVAREDILDQTTNPEGGSDRPYWLVIEEGSDRWQPQMIGRVLFGKFHGPEGESRPSQDRFQQDSSFVFGRSQPLSILGHSVPNPFGQSGGGIGQVERAIEPQHYLERGSEVGWEEYVAAIQIISVRFAKRLREIDGRRLARERFAALEAGFLAR